MGTHRCASMHTDIAMQCMAPFHKIHRHCYNDTTVPTSLLKRARPDPPGLATALSKTDSMLWRTTHQPSAIPCSTPTLERHRGSFSTALHMLLYGHPARFLSDWDHARPRRDEGEWWRIQSAH